MQKTLNYKGYRITIAPTDIEDWKGRLGYRVTVVRKGFRPVVSFQNFPNATQATLTVKKAIDKGEIPQEKTGLIQRVRSIFA